MPPSVIPAKAGNQSSSVIPAKAGIQGMRGKRNAGSFGFRAMHWIPACAGMTEGGGNDGWARE